jgi:hypothetical protein
VESPDDQVYQTDKGIKQRKNKKENNIQFLEYLLASHLDSQEQQSIQNLHGLSFSIVWLKGRRGMILG